MRFLSKPMETQFARIADGWQLTDTQITVRNAGGFWTIYVVDCPVMPGNYTSEHAAKRDAWAYAYKRRRVAVRHLPA
jgi:hypothetical protein